jgi:hypothetical protein
LIFILKGYSYKEHLIVFQGLLIFTEGFQYIADVIWGTSMLTHALEHRPWDTPYREDVQRGWIIHP